MMKISIIFGIFFVQIFASPHIPEVVYPRKADSTQFSQKATDGSESIRIPNTSTSSSIEEHYRYMLEHRKHKEPIDSSHERTRRPPTRILFAPIDGAEVFTADDYSGYNSPANGVPNFTVDKDFEDSSSKERENDQRTPQTVRPLMTIKRTKQRKTTTTTTPTTTPSTTPTTTTSTDPTTTRGSMVKSLKVQHKGFRGQSLVAEIDVQRTTMQESATGLVEIVEMTTPLTTTKSTSEPVLKSGFIRIRPHNRALNGTKNSSPTKELDGNTRIAQELQPLNRPSAEKRFPAKKWQIPPSISGSPVSPVQFDRTRSPPNFVNNYNTRQTISQRNQLPRNNFQQDPRPRGQLYQPQSTLPVLTPDTLLSPFQALTAAIIPGANILLPGQTSFQMSDIPRPPEPKGTNHSHLFHRSQKPKYHATFAKHNDVIKPIPLPATIDENDMDLLMPSAHAINQLRPYPQLEPVPIPGPIQPVTTTFGQQGFETSEYKPVLDTNAKLALCCQKQQLSTSCQSLCNFDTFTDKTLVSTFLTNQCPEPQRGLAFQCATTRVDHTECCQRNSVHLHAGGQCMPFCATHIPTPPNVFSYLPCLQVFDRIKNCYREYQSKNPNIFGD
uniref:Uncharacterized protein n=1 Tax=Panagrolaimus sp. JU765 TaxID=591449 RepID=A0AC34QLV7_9BILA